MFVAQRGCPNIAVIGAGVVGLSSAFCMQSDIPGASVTVIADKFNEETLSDGAGGIFRPELSIGPNIDLLKQWCKESYEYFMKILRSSDAAPAGIQLVSGYYLSSLGKRYAENSVLSDLLPEMREISAKELSMFPENFKTGLFYTTIIIDCRKYLPWMKRRFEARGGKVKYKTITSFHELASEYDVVVNCTGLGAKVLANDYRMTPVRGQTIKVNAPWIKHFYFGDEVYIIPGTEYVTLGGIKEYGSWNPNINPYHRTIIWEKCLQLVPSLQKAKIEWEWVGLRPFRQPVRVESETVECGDKRLLTVHNYGHGGNGVTLSWGTAKHATKLVADLLKNNRKF